MNTGREMDAIVAEKVMGYTFTSYNGVEIIGHPGCSPYNGPFLLSKNVSVVPPYSTDIAAAWQVVKKLRGPKLAFSLVTVWDQKLDKHQWLAKWEFWGSEQVEWALADEAPHAICLAALKAVGAPVGPE